MPKVIVRCELLVPLQRGTNTPLRLQLERALRVAIQTGRLTPGSAVPSTRVLAAELGVSRGLVVEAYEQLLAEGYLSSRGGSSTAVARRCHSVPIPSDDRAEGLKIPRYDFRPGRPDHSLFPRRAWLSALRRAINAAPATAFDYPDAKGSLTARSIIAAYLNRSRATAASAGQTILCSGFAQGMRLVCETLKARGVWRIAVEDPGHAYESADVRASGLEMVPVPVDGEGICVDRLAKLGVQAVYVTPAHQFPTGAVLSPSRRAALLTWAERRNGLILEDDYDGEYRYDRDPIGALQGLNPERVIYLGSASKVLAPALRIGWLLSPQSLLAELSQAKLNADRGSPTIDHLALSEFIECGHLDRHLRRTRVIYARRRAMLAAALARHLPRFPIRGVAAGLHLTLELRRGTNETAVIQEAERRGISLHGLNLYRARPTLGSPALVLGYCRVSESSISQGAKALAQMINRA